MEENADSVAAARAEKPATRPKWQEIAASPEFVRLQTMRRRMTLAALTLFAVVLGTFFVLCAYARPFMSRSVDGGLTVAYVWLLSLTVLAWVLAWTYLRFAERRLGPAAQRVIAAAESGEEA